MNPDDVIYISLLTFTIVFGYFFKCIENSEKKKWISTSVGFLIVLFVSGFHVLHSIFCTLVNIILILYVSKRMCHIYSFIFNFLYLMFFRSTVYFGINYPPLHTNMVQMILTLKIIGLAFEVHDSYVETNSKKKDDKILNEISPSGLEIIHYIYCHIGVLTGPYYSYKTFRDYYKTDFYKYADSQSLLKQKLMFVPFYAFLFLLFSKYYPVQYAESDEFYSETTFWFRLWYITPVFISFRMRIYIGLILSEASCIIAGLGAYPSLSEPKPGKGPSVDIETTSEIEEYKSMESGKSYNFNTVLNINTWYTEFDPLVRSSIRYWNMCIQYWMAYIVYKRFPIKSLRTIATFVVSAVWHGVYAGYYLCLGLVPFYLFIEDLWVQLLMKNLVGTKKIIINILFWIVRTQAFSYLGMAFSLLSMRNGLRYYSSVYFIYHATSILALLIGLALKKVK